MLSQSVHGIGGFTGEHFLEKFVQDQPAFVTSLDRDWFEGSGWLVRVGRRPHLRGFGRQSICASRMRNLP